LLSFGCFVCSRLGVFWPLHAPPLEGPCFLPCWGWAVYCGKAAAGYDTKISGGAFAGLSMTHVHPLHTPPLEGPFCLLSFGCFVCSRLGVVWPLHAPPLEGLFLFAISGVDSPPLTWQKARTHPQHGKTLSTVETLWRGYENRGCLRRAINDPRASTPPTAVRRSLFFAMLGVGCVLWESCGATATITVVCDNRGRFRQAINDPRASTTGPFSAIPHSGLRRDFVNNP
jgi:hypothetical protein